MADWNSRSFDYRNYTNNLVEENTAFTVPLYDLHADFLAELTNRSETLANYMDAAGLELNETGQQLYGELFANSLRTKMVDTTAGLYVEGEKPAYTPIAPSLVVPVAPVTVTEEPVTVIEEPVYEEPTYEYVAPTYEDPVYEYVAPVVETPVTPATPATPIQPSEDPITEPETTITE